MVDLPPVVYAAAGGVTYWFVQNIMMPYGRQIRDASYTDPPEQSDSGV